MGWTDRPGQWRRDWLTVAGVHGWSKVKWALILYIEVWVTALTTADPEVRQEELEVDGLWEAERKAWGPGCGRGP